MKITPADKAFSDVVRHKSTCDRCGKVGRVECSHVYGRRHRTIRWDLLNAKPLCHGCHRWWHENPLEASLWFNEKYGEARRDILLEKKRSRIKVSKLEEKDIAKHYREELKKMEADDNYEPVSYQ